LHPSVQLFAITPIPGLQAKGSIKEMIMMLHFIFCARETESITQTKPECWFLGSYYHMRKFISML